MMTNYCRLCMAEDDLEQIDAFTRDAIHTEFSIIRTNDELSRKICKKCSKFILKMVDYKRNVLNVQKVLKKVVKMKKIKIESGSTETPTTWTVSNIENRNDASHDEESSFDKKDVSMNPESSKKRKRKSHSSYSKRQKITLKTEPTTINDEIPSDDSAVEEVDPTAGGCTTINVDDDSNKSTNPNSFPCKFCSATFGFIETLGQHLKKHHDGHLCTKCGYISVSAKSYAKHLRSHYNLTYNHRVCLSCFKICNDQAEFYAHKKLVHDAGKSSFVCSDCSEEFTTLEEFENHKRRVHPTTQNEDIQCDTTSTESVSVEDSEIQTPDSANIVDLEQSDENIDSVNEDQPPENTSETDEPDDPPVEISNAEISETDEPDDPSMEIPNAEISENCQSRLEEFSENSEANCDTRNADSSTSQRKSRKLEIPKIMNKRGILHKPKYAKIFIPKTKWFLCRLCFCRVYRIAELQRHYDECIGRRKCIICSKILSCREELVLHKHVVHKILLSQKKFQSYIKQFEEIKRKKEEEIKRKKEEEIKRKKEEEELVTRLLA